MHRIAHLEQKNEGGDPGGWTDPVERDAVHHGQNHGDLVLPCHGRTTAASRTIPIIGATEAVLSLFYTIRPWSVTLDCTQRDLGIRNRGKRIGIPITSDPPYPWWNKTNITDSSRSVRVYRSCDAIDAQILREIPFVVISEVSVDLRLKGGNHIRILRQLDITQEDIGLCTSTEEHVVLRLEPEV